MQVGAFHVEIAVNVAAPVHPHGDEDVYRKTDHGNGEHADGGDFRRMQQAADGFDDNPEDDGGERQAVQGGGDDFTATVAEGVFERGRAVAPVKGGRRERPRAMASESICPASERRARLLVSRPPAISTSMKAAMSSSEYLRTVYCACERGTWGAPAGFAVILPEARDAAVTG